MTHVTLKVGDWSVPIELNAFKTGFVYDWYEEFKQDTLVADHLSFIPKQWSRLVDLHQWERVGLGVFDVTDSLTLQHKLRLLEPVRYAEVEQVARTLGTSTDDWPSFTIIDRCVPQAERMKLYKSVGRCMMKRGTVYPPFEGLAGVLAEAKEHLDEETLTGIVHNSMLIGMTRDKGRYINWSYVLWEDMELLCDPSSPILPTVLYFLVKGPTPKVELSCRSLNIEEKGLSILFQRGVEAIDPRASLSAVGLKVLEHGAVVLARTTQLPLDKLVPHIIESMCNAERNVSVEVDWFIAKVGWFAASLVYQVLTNQYVWLSEYGRDFLLLLDKRLLPMVETIEHYKTMNLYDLAQNDPEGMLLRL